MGIDKSRHREAYVRIIQFGMSGDADVQYAAELIAAGYAKGVPIADLSSRAPGGIDDVIWEGPTVKGRRLADEMSAELSAESWNAKFVKLSLILAAGLGGLLAGLLLAYLTKMFGLC